MAKLEEARGIHSQLPAHPCGMLFGYSPRVINRSPLDRAQIHCQFGKG